VLDIVPTGEAWARADWRFVLVNPHWGFLAQPAPRPQRVIGADPDAYYYAGDTSLFDPEALWYDPLAVWREWAGDVTGRAIDTGHFLAEERPDEVAQELRRFFRPS
jgi:haloacetate dehalogenase